MEDIGYNYRQKNITHGPGPGQAALATQQLRGSSVLCRQEPNARRETARNKLSVIQLQLTSSEKTMHRIPERQRNHRIKSLKCKPQH